MVTAPLILASASPRRSQLLAAAGVSFEILPADIDEAVKSGEAPAAYVARLAAEKALAVARRAGPAPRRCVLGADTIVVLDDVILGKPRDAENAVEMLGRLTGRAHDVITAVAVATSDTLELRSRSVTSRVNMRPASNAEILAYVETGECLDKAGAYAIQGGGRIFVTDLAGSESNVIGLPLEETLALLAEVDAGADEAAP